MAKKPILERRLVTYPHPKYHRLFIADCYSSATGKAEHLERIIRKHYDSLNESERKNLSILWEEMTEEQRKHPKR